MAADPSTEIEVGGADHVADRFAYRPLVESAPSRWRASLAICRWNLRLIMRHRTFWLIVALGLMHFLLHFALIYTKAQVIVQQPRVAKFLDRYLVTGDGNAYREFLTMQSRAVILLLAYAGVVLVGSDFRMGGISFYLSKPIGKLQYVFGKLLALWTIVGVLTLVPALVLFAEYGLFSDSIRYWSENPRIFVGIVGYSLLLMIVPSFLLLAVGAVCRRAAPLVMVWLTLFLVLPALGELLRTIFDSRGWRLINLWQTMRMLGELAFGVIRFQSERGYVGAAAVILLAVCGLSIAVLSWRLRAVEVVE